MHCSGLQGIDHRLIVDGLLELAAIAVRPRIGLAVRQIGYVAVDAQVGRNDIAVAGVVQLQHKAAVTGDDAGFHRALYRLIHSKAGVALGYGSSAGIGSAGQLIRISLHIRAVQLLLIVLHLVGGIGIGRPRGVQVRPAGHGLAGHILILTLAAPVLEGVTLAGGSGSVCGGQSRTPADGGGVQQAIVLAVILLVSSQILSGLEVDNLIKVIDHALQVRPAVDGDPLQTGGRIGKVLRVLIPLAVVIPAVEFNVALVIVADLQLGQVDDRAGQLGIQRDISVSLGGIAVAIDHNMDRDAVSGLNDVVHASFLRLADPLAGFLIKGQNPGQGSGTDKLMCLFLGLRARRISLHKGSSIQHDIIRAVLILRQLIAIVAAQYPVGARSVLGAGVDALDRHSHIAQRGLHVIIGGAIRGRLDLFLADALDVSGNTIGAGDQIPLVIIPAPGHDGLFVGLLILVLPLGISIKLINKACSVQLDGVGEHVAFLNLTDNIIVILASDTVLQRMRFMVRGIRGALNANLTVHIGKGRRTSGFSGRLGTFLLGAAAVGVCAALNGAVAIGILGVHAFIVRIAEAVTVTIRMLVVLPNRVDGLAGVCGEAIATMIICHSRGCAISPTKEVEAATDGNLGRDRERCAVALFYILLLLRRHICDTAAVAVIGQGDVFLGGRILCHQINRRAFVACGGGR